MDRNGSPGLSTPFHLALSVKPWDHQRWAEGTKLDRRCFATFHGLKSTWWSFPPVDLF